VEAMSYVFPRWPFPYSHETVFDGLDQMEYPMMVNDNPVASREDAITLTNHEVFHTMFPFYVGINETKYGWMDEGWATLGEWLISSIIDSSIKDNYGMPQYDYYAGREIDLPITTLTTQQNGLALFLNSYPKPALGYLYVKDLLGEELFLKALHFYIGQWQGKHPMPFDFFNCINTASGKNLNWFWKRWFFDNGVPDLAIARVSKKGKNFEIVIESKGTKPVPIDLQIDFDDNTSRKEHRNVSVWQNGNNRVTITTAADKAISGMVLGSLYVPDINKANNVYKARQ
jgi:aminopeptidase N